MGLLIFAEGTSAFFAWKTAYLPEDFRDSSSVLFAICTHIQAWAIGLPILAVLGNSSTNATYLGRVLLIWLFAVSSVACVIYPKLARAIYLRRHPERRQKHRVSISGLNLPTAGTHPVDQSSSMDRPAELSLRVAELEAQLEDYKRRFATEIATT
jgi:hypothetical protein